MKKTLVWGCIVCPTRKGIKALQLNTDDYGIFLGETKNGQLCVVRRNQTSPCYYHKSFWRYLEGQN